MCNVHKWLEGECDHEEDDHDKTLPWFDRRDEDYIELQKVVLNPELLASFQYYTRFRSIFVLQLPFLDIFYKSLNELNGRMHHTGNIIRMKFLV